MNKFMKNNKLDLRFIVIMNKKLISDDTLNAYKTRFEVMNREKDTEEGNRLFAFKTSSW